MTTNTNTNTNTSAPAPIPSLREALETARPRHESAKRDIKRIRNRLAERLTADTGREMFGAEIADVAALIVKMERILGAFEFRCCPWTEGGSDMPREDANAIRELALDASDLLRDSLSYETRPSIMLDTYGKRGWRKADRRIMRGL